jgi:amidase
VSSKRENPLIKLIHSSSSVQVTLAFCHRAVIAHQLLNCCTEIFFDLALKQAEELDAIFKESGPVGPLHGLPISLKDQFEVKDVEINMGYVSWIGNISKRDSVSNHTRADQS